MYNKLSFLLFFQVYQISNTENILGWLVTFINNW